MIFDEKFFLAIAFFTFAALILKFVWPIMARGLDAKSKSVAEEILAAKEMKEKAEKLLDEAEKYHEESRNFSKKIIADTKKEAEKLAKEAKKALESEIKNKTDAALTRIKIEEETAIRGIKTQIVESTIESISADLSKISDSEHDKLIKKAGKKLQEAL